MTSKKRRVASLLSFCMSLLLVCTCVCGCDDLGDFEDTQEYYDSFGEIRLIGGTREGTEPYPSNEYSVKDKFYNTASREDFLEDAEGNYAGVPLEDYIYMVVPLEADLRIDSFALYMRGERAATVYISMFLVNEVPSSIQGIGDPSTKTEEKDGVVIEESIEYDDPDADAILANSRVSLTPNKWSSFLIDEFTVNGQFSKVVEAKKGQYILILFRNNSDALTAFGEEGERLDSITGAPLDRERFTMTNLLVRAVEPE